MPERVHAARAHDEVQAGGKQHGHQQVNSQHQHIGLPGGEPRQRDQRVDQQHTRDQRGAPPRPQGPFAGRATAHQRRRPAHQPPGARDEHHGHDQELGHQRKLGKRHVDPEDRHHAQPDANRLDLRDQQCGDVRTRDGPHAAEHDDDESGTDDFEIEFEARRLAGQLQCAAQTGERRAQRENGRKQPCLIDPERGDHLAILCGCAHQRAETGAGQRQPQHPQYDRPGSDQQQVIGRKVAPEDRDGTREARGARPEELLGPPCPKHGILHDENDGKGRQQLKQLRRLVDAPHEQNLDCGAGQPDHDRGNQERRPEPGARAQQRRQGVGKVNAQHIERAMREIDDARDPEDQRQPGRDEKKRGRPGKSVEQLYDKA